MALRIRTVSLPDGDVLPLIVQPADEPGDPRDFFAWVAEERDWLDARLLAHGAVLFGGFGLEGAGAVERLLGAAGYPALAYLRGTAPRDRVRGRVYRSTYVPAFLPLPLHTEMSYTSTAPRYLVLFCDIAARRGGATPLADMRRVTAAIPDEIRGAFERGGVRYVQNVPRERSLLRMRPWPAMFETEDRDEVEAICRAQSVSCTWREDGSLRLVNVRPAFAPHPVTGERLWFNQAHVFHGSYSSELRACGRRLGAWLVGRRERREQRRPPETRRFAVTLADGSEIPRPWVEAVREAHRSAAVRRPWRTGDLLVLDNHRVAHGRDPYRGPRRVLAALVGDPGPAREGRGRDAPYPNPVSPG